MIYKYRRKLDSLGIGVSLACAVHCALLPLIIAVLPLLGLEFLANNYFELAIIASSAIIGYTSLINSVKQHGQLLPLTILTMGFVVIFSGKLLVSQHHEWPFLTAGGLLIATAHFYNLRLNIHNHVCD